MSKCVTHSLIYSYPHLLLYFSKRYMSMDFSQIIRRLYNTATIDDVIYVTGLILLGIWLLKTSIGRTALADSRPRRNNMPPFLPFILLFIGFVAPFLMVLAITKIAGEFVGWRESFLKNLILSASEAMVAVFIIFLARTSFAGRLKGFGLNFKTIHRDLCAAFVNLLAIWPVVMATVVATLYIGERIYGPDFQIEQHEELKLITAYRQLSLRILIVVLAVVIVPVFEEMIFRGLFQTVIRSMLETRNLICHPYSGQNAAWPAILMTSAVFAMTHANTGHWPALFVLSVCLGYAYEKSGSLFRPIFIHSFFNATVIITVLSQ